MNGRRTLMVGLAAAMAVACGSAVNDTPADAGKDAVADAPRDGNTDGGARCCTPDPAPGCCMDYGGWSDTGFCAKSCDGMPLPSDPSWAKVKDSHGCDVWTSASGGPKCGGVVLPDAGKDASDASSDANGQ